MKTTINVNDFRDAFQAIRPDNFSYDALGQLFDHYEQYEEETGEEIELDVVAICCDWTETSLEDFNQDYGTDFEDIDEAIEYAKEQGGYAFETDNEDEPSILYLAF